MSRVDIMRRLHVIEGKTSSFFESTNHEYFCSTRRYDGWLSPVARGFLAPVAFKRGRGGRIFGLTDAGQKLAAEYKAWMCNSR
jgi:hypothetical protein